MSDLHRRISWALAFEAEAAVTDPAEPLRFYRALPPDSEGSARHPAFRADGELRSHRPPGDPASDGATVSTLPFRYPVDPPPDDCA